MNLIEIGNGVRGVNSIIDISRLFALVGCPAPKPRTRAMDELVHCPAQHLIRAVAWYALQRDRYAPGRLVHGLELISSGWGDVVEVSRITRGSPDATREAGHEIGHGRRVEIRPASSGRSGKSLEIRYVDGTRARLEVATAWLAAAAAATGLT